MNRFDNVAKDWESKPSRVQIAKSSVDNIIEIVDLKPNFKILDYGCGTGLVGFGLSNETNTVIGMDYSIGMVETFNETAKELGFTNEEIYNMKNITLYDELVINPTEAQMLQ